MGIERMKRMEGSLELGVVPLVDTCVGLLDAIKRRDEDIAQVLLELFSFERERTLERRLSPEPRRVRVDRLTLKNFNELHIAIYGIWVRPTCGG